MLELLSARMLLPDAASDSAALLQRLERLERRQGLAVSASTADPAPARLERPAAKTEPAGKAEPASRAAAKVEPAAQAGAPATGQPPVPAEQPPGQAEQSPGQAEQPPTQAERPEPVSEAKPAEAAEPGPAAQPAVVGDAAPDSNALRQLWPDVMAALKDRSRVKWAMMNEVVIASVEGEVVNLLAPAGLARRIAEDANLSVLREVLQSVVFGHWRLVISSAANGAAAPLPDEPPADPEPEPAPRAARPARQPRPAPAAPVEQPPPVIDDDGVDEESDEVHGSKRAGGDAEAAAMELLQTSLGARPIDAS
jgi:DNA polymerase-3 subunit gamma/tau